ncbi:MAG TPA: hypothetical protein VFI78_07010, partial [Salinimicrobium sp.]|nr:hypothetical protein [Salinimicrobium sp.]
WLLFPFHLVWDKMEAAYDSSAVAPMTGKSMQQLSITYPQNAGYTPGDVYEIYFNDDYIIQEWIYKPGGNEEKALIASWEDYKTMNGIKFSTNHRNKDGTFQIYFTNIDVE